MTLAKSSPSDRIKLALDYKGIEYVTRIAELEEVVNSADYEVMNPMRPVPILLIDGLTLTQSLPIIEYLDETRPHNRLLPADPVKRVHVRRLAEIINSCMHPLQNATGRVVPLAPGSLEARKNCAKQWIVRG